MSRWDLTWVAVTVLTEGQMVFKAQTWERGRGRHSLPESGYLVQEPPSGYFYLFLFGNSSLLGPVTIWWETVSPACSSLESDLGSASFHWARSARNQGTPYQSLARNWGKCLCLIPFTAALRWFIVLNQVTGTIHGSSWRKRIGLIPALFEGNFLERIKNNTC